MPVTPNSIVTPQALNVAVQKFETADGTNTKDILTAGANGSLINGLIANSTDGGGKYIKLYVNDGSTDWLLGTISIPGNSGSNGTTAGINLLNLIMIPGLPLDGQGNPYLKIKAGHKLRGSLIASANVVTVVAFGEDL